MTIDVNSLSPELRNLVVKNGQVDLTELKRAADNKSLTAALREEAGKLLQAELSGNGNFGKIGDGFVSPNGISAWWNDKDKVSTDGKDDGEISFSQTAYSFVKGFCGGIVKAVVKHPIESAITFGAAVGLTAITGGAALPYIIGAGVLLGGYQAGKGVADAIAADNDGDMKQAIEDIGTGVASMGLSAVGVKAANRTAANAGVEGLEGLEDASFLDNVIAFVKSLPEAAKAGIKNAQMKIRQWRGLDIKQAKIKGETIKNDFEKQMDDTMKNCVSRRETPDKSGGFELEYLDKDGTVIATRKYDGLNTIMEESILNKDGSKFTRYYEEFINGSYRDCSKPSSYEFRFPDLDSNRYRFHYDENGNIQSVITVYIRQ